MLLKINENIIAIIESATLLPNITRLQALLKYLKISGFHYVFVQLTKQSIFNLGSWVVKILHFKDQNSSFYSYKNLLSGKKQIQIFKMADINDTDSIRLLRSLRPDLILSLFFNQILNKEVLNIPSKGTINIHPALLPNYRGVSPVFWCLANDEKETGVTVHFINEGIDTGSIINQSRVEIKSDDTEDSLYKRCVKKGAPLLFRAISEIKKSTISSRSLKGQIGGRYFSLPSKRAVKKFIKKRHFFRLKKFFTKF